MGWTEQRKNYVFINKRQPLTPDPVLGYFQMAHRGPNIHELHLDGCGQVAVGRLQWAVGRLQWAVGSGQFAVGSGQWAVCSGQWAVGRLQWAVRWRQFAVGNGQIFNSGLIDV
jgi:hypothetical protein